MNNVYNVHSFVITQVAKKLIVMYEECLQNNFSSIEKLREESLS
jgi:hypothetical protein